jgi:hypothetical protein
VSSDLGFGLQLFTATPVCSHTLSGVVGFMAYVTHGMDRDCCARHTRNMPSPFCLQERIRELCAKVLSASDAECQEALRELRKLLHEHSESLRKLAADKLGNT